MLDVIIALVLLDITNVCLANTELKMKNIKRENEIEFSLMV